MVPDELKEHFERIEILVAEMNRFAPPEARGVADFRADLAGMLIVTIAAVYETCVKTSMVTYAAKHGKAFEGFAERNYSKLSSRIMHNDLRRYASTFDVSICRKYEEVLDRRRKAAVRLSGRNPIKQLELILGWRHDFAHAGLRQTTIEEAVSTHRLASVVIFSFHKAFVESL